MEYFCRLCASNSNHLQSLHVSLDELHLSGYSEKQSWRQFTIGAFKGL